MKRLFALLLVVIVLLPYSSAFAAQTGSYDVETVTTEADLNEWELKRIERANKLMDEGEYKEAAKWLYQLADEKNYAEAQYMLAKCYLFDNPYSNDEEKGFEYACKAAEQLYPDGFYLVGYCYKMGWGVGEQADEAAKWFGYAAILGSEAGMLWRGYCYQTGYGIEKDEQKARMWYENLIDIGTSKRLVKQAKERLKEMN